MIVRTWVQEFKDDSCKPITHVDAGLTRAKSSKEFFMTFRSGEGVVAEVVMTANDLKDFLDAVGKFAIHLPKPSPGVKYEFDFE
jgi:hypothetical protein